MTMRGVREWARSIFYPTPEEKLARELKDLAEYRQRFPQEDQAFILSMQQRVTDHRPIAEAGMAHIRRLLVELDGILTP